MYEYRMLKREGVMINTTLVQVRVDQALKDEVTHIYDYYGLDLPTAIRIFMKKRLLLMGFLSTFAMKQIKKIFGNILEVARISK